MSTALATALRHRRTVGKVVGAVAVLLTLAAAFFGAGNLLFQLRAEAATGSVVELETLKDEAGQVRVPVQYTVLVRFTDGSGNTHEFTDPRPLSDPPAVGEDVPVLYAVADPGQARIREYLVMYREAIFCGAWALVLGIAAEELIRRRQELSGPPRPG